MNDAPLGHEWSAPDGPPEPSVGQVPDAPASAAPAAPPAPIAVAAVAAAPVAPTFRSWQPGIIPLRPVSFGEFLAVPFKALRYNRAVIVGGPLLCVGVSMVLLAAAMWLAFTDPSLALLAPTDQLQGIEASTVVVAIAAFLALILADVLSCAIVAPGVARAVLGERIPVGEALKAVGPRVGSLLLLWLLSGVALLVALIPGLAVMGLAAANDNGGLIGVGVLLMGVFGLVAGIPIYVIAAEARCVIVLEHKGAIASVRRTRSLIRGRFWWSVLIIFVTGTLIYIATAIIQQLLSFVGAIALAIGFSGEWVGVAVFVAVLVLGAVVSYVFTYAYMGTVYALIYIDARIRHEGFDIDLARAAEARRG